MKDLKTFEQESQEVRALLVRLKTYRKVAKKLGKSIYWVQTRLHRTYGPFLKLNKTKFQNEVVIPYLIKEGYEIDEEYEIKQKIISKQMPLICKRKNMTFVFKIIYKLNRENLKEAIGDLVFTSLSNDKNKLRLIIYVDKDPQVQQKREQYIKKLNLFNIKKYNIDIIFM